MAAPGMRRDKPATFLEEPREDEHAFAVNLDQALHHPLELPGEIQLPEMLLDRGVGVVGAGRIRAELRPIETLNLVVLQFRQVPSRNSCSFWTW